MHISTISIKVKTNGQGHFVDVTPRLKRALGETGYDEGQVTICVVGSTAGICSVEFEPGLVEHDLNAVFNALAPRDKDYAHHGTWGDDNGSSHIRATLLGPSITIPFKKSELYLGQWQQIALAEFDTSARERQVVFQFIGV
jgi:secondary thiamine-phosphate synthase enzyme